MAVPKRRKSRARVRTRQQQWRAKAATITKCPTCNAVALPHRACLTCGHYNGRAILPPKVKSTPRGE